MKIPIIQEGIAESIAVNLTGSQKNNNWAVEQMVKLKLNNPRIAQFLLSIIQRKNEEAAIVGIVVYRMIESQMEANELKELIG